jgi:Xaa-Pro aminopeptidase
MAVGGKFTRRQEKIYNAVLRISQFAKSVVKVGITFKELQMMTGEKMKEELSELGLLKGSELKGDEYKKYFMHGVSHSLGLDVHDLCDRKLPFCENMVITIEPGIYVQDEGVGVRIEDDVVVKGGCCEVLTEGISL